MVEIKIGELEILEIIRKNLFNAWGLLTGSIFILILITQVNGFFSEYQHDSISRIVVYLLLEMEWVLVWIFNRYHIPRPKKNTIGIVICISGDNAKAIKGFYRGLRRHVTQNGLAHKVSVVLMNSYHAEQLNEALKHHESIRLEIMRTGDVPKRLPKDLRILKRLKGHFFIYGDVSEEMERGESCFFYYLSALVINKPLEREIHLEFMREFQRVWTKELKIRTSDSHEENQWITRNLYFIFKYITGQAAFLSGDFLFSFDFHQSLLVELNKVSDLPRNLNNLPIKVLSLASLEAWILAKKAFIDKDYATAQKYCFLSQTINPKYYSAYALLAIVRFKSERDVDGAMKLVNISMQYAPNTEWLYNKAFLMMYKRDFPEALRFYKKILNRSYYEEEFSLDEILDFLVDILEEEPDFYPAHYIAGLLQYEKRGNLPAGLVEFDKFMKKTEGFPGYEYLRVRARIYINEIEKSLEKLSKQSDRQNKKSGRWWRWIRR